MPPQQAHRKPSIAQWRQYLQFVGSPTSPASPASSAPAGALAVGRARDRQQRERRGADEQPCRARARKLRRDVRRASARAPRSTRRSIHAPVAAHRRAASLRSACDAEVVLDRRDAALHRLEQALEMLARVHQALARARRRRASISTAYGSLPTWYVRPSERRQHVREVVEPLGAHEGLVLGARPVAREHDVEPMRPRGARSSAATGSSVLQTGQVGERKKSSVLRPSSRGAADRVRRAVEVLDLDDGRRLADLRPVSLAAARRPARRARTARRSGAPAPPPRPRAPRPRSRATTFETSSACVTPPPAGGRARARAPAGDPPRLQQRGEHAVPPTTVNASTQTSGRAATGTSAASASAAASEPRCARPASR